MAMNELTTTLAVQPVGGPSAVLEYGGLRWLTDPSLSPPETTLPAVQPDAILPIDVVLLWHDHHGDNIDAAGRELLPRAGQVLRTVAGARRLAGNAVGLRPWSSVELAGPDGSAIRVTAVPASAWSGRQRCCHGARDWIPARGAWGRERYVSGDNASLGVVREIARLAGPIGVAVVFVGALQRAQERLRVSHAGQRSRRRCREDPRRPQVVPVHYEGWAQLHAGCRPAPRGVRRQRRIRSTRAGQTRSEDRAMKPNHEQLLACSHRTTGRSNENVSSH
jgi:L-ascorbate metabolism protein UlaG (beta-lactamase superfamily)